MSVIRECWKIKSIKKHGSWCVLIYYSFSGWSSVFDRVFDSNAMDALGFLDAADIGFCSGGIASGLIFCLNVVRLIASGVACNEVLSAGGTALKRRIRRWIIGLRLAILDGLSKTGVTEKRFGPEFWRIVMIRLRGIAIDGLGTLRRFDPADGGVSNGVENETEARRADWATNEIRRFVRFSRPIGPTIFLTCALSMARIKSAIVVFSRSCSEHDD